jgi:hypothetical protein
MRAEVDAKLRALRLTPLAGDWTASWADRALGLRDLARLLRCQQCGTRGAVKVWLSER